MNHENECPIPMKKESLLKEMPVYQNMVTVDDIWHDNCTLSELHFHEFIEISFVVSGSGYHQVWNNISECSKRDMYILNAGVPHKYFAKSETEMPVICNLLFDPSDFFNGDISNPLSNEYCYGIFSENAAYTYLSLKLRQADILDNLYKLIETECMEKNIYWLEEIKAYLTGYLINVKRFLNENKKAVTDIKSRDRLIITNAVRYVMENYSDSDMTLETISKSLYMSKSYLSRMFRNVTGEYFADYVRNVRLKQACHLLEETRMTNEQIIYNCGFKDIPTFYSLFKAQYKQTPNQYRLVSAKQGIPTYTRGNGMTGTERVRNVLTGKSFDRQPIYGWIDNDLRNEITRMYGSVAGFEDKYEFDLAHIFGGPQAFNWRIIEKIRVSNNELTPPLLLSENIFISPENSYDYKEISNSLTFHKKRGRFCYIQTPGFFEQFNSIFGIEKQLLYLAMYPTELFTLYKRQADWTIHFAEHCIDMGIDMIHISDDWGSQKDILFSPNLWREIIYPNLKMVIDYVHSRNCFVSIHSDGNIKKICPKLAELGIDAVHPWQESAGMTYDLWLNRYSDKFALFGGICVQTALGVMKRDKLEEEIHRIFEKLKGKRWICCTTQFVQSNCSVDDIKFAYDLIYRLAKEQALLI